MPVRVTLCVSWVGWAVMVLATAGVITSQSRRCFPTSTIRRRDDTRNSYTATMERRSRIQMTSHINLIGDNVNFMQFFHLIATAQ